MINRPIESNFCIHIIIDKICFGIVMRHFSQNCIRVTALDVRFWFLLHILRMNEQNLINFCVQIVIDKIGIVMSDFLANLQQSNGPLLTSEFVLLCFSYYLENKWTEFNQIFYTHYH